MFPDFFERAMEETQSDSASTKPRSEVFVVSIGGSLIMQEQSLNVEAIQRIAASINTLVSEGYKIALVVGGGSICRSYLETGEKIGANQFALDELGIAVTRANAFLFVQAISNSFSHVVTRFEKVEGILEQGKVPILGGMLPGCTTDCVGALLAEKLNGTFVNLSNVDGVYSADPAVSKRAKLFRELSFEKLFQIATATEAKPGQHSAIDVPAALILKRSKIPAIFVNGTTLENFESAIKNQAFNGTVVQTSDSEIKSLETTFPKPLEEETDSPIRPEEIEPES
ncbi:UMP kinase [Candidatus Micrarchaeota archaeon]|nr:UMP kinase [Candidatus Micrarchaeota archaeon]MBU1930481.1 UMP kinase [Candidatus Micrarchaeota archaeon]